MGDQWTDLPLAVQESHGLTTSCELINMLLLKLPQESQRPFAIATVPAISSSATPITSGSGDMRGMIFHADKLWYVRGTQLYYTSNGTSATLVGTVSGTAKVRMVGAGAGQIAIVDGAGNQYIATTTAINSFSLPAGIAADVAFMDGYIICPRSGTDEWYISALDGVTFAALDFSTADAISDTLIGVVACNRDLFLIGKIHTEIWYNAGASPFPFLRASPGVIERGGLATSTIKNAGGVVYFVGNDRRTYRLRGYAPEPVSTEAVDRLMNLVNPATLAASVYTFKSQQIYAVQIDPASGATGRTLEYNITTGLWHLRLGCAGFRCDFTPSFITYAFHAGESASGVAGVYRLEPAEADPLLSYYMALPWFDAGGRRVFEHELEIIGGVSFGPGSGSAALVTNDSPDGLLATTHATISLNQYRLAWHRLGSFRRRRHEFTLTSIDAPVVVEAVRARMDVGL